MAVGDQEAKRVRADAVLAAVRAASPDPSTVRELVATTGLSRPTVISLLASLDRCEVVRRSDLTAENGVGRPASSWEINPQAGIVVAADILVTSALIVVAAVDGEILQARTVSLDRQEREARLDEVTEAISTMVSQSEPEHGELRQIGISTTGIIDGDGAIQRSDLVPQWNGLALGAELSARLGAPAFVDNDINLAAYGEFVTRRQSGTIRADGDLLMVHMTRGFNTGLVLGGRVHQGRQWNAGEVSDVLGQPYDQFDSPSQEWVNQCAVVIGTAAAVIDPDLIVVTGPTPNSLPGVRRVLARVISNRPADAPPLVAEVSRLGWGASVTGALGMALREALRGLLGVPDPNPVELRHFGLVTSELQKGSHTTMSTSTPAPLHSDTLRVGVVGVGARSRLALNTELAENNGVITAVAEPHHLARQRIADRLHKDPDEVSISPDVEGLISAGVDVAFVTSPDDTHADVTCALLEAGIPVYLEKPLAITMESATRVLTTAFQTGTRLYVGHNMRHMNVVRSMRDLIRTGRIGEVKAIWCRHFVGNGGDYYFKDWHATREHGTGLLLQKAAHDIDVMHWFADSHTTDVVAMGGLTLYDQVTDRRSHSDELMGDWFSHDNWPPLSQKGLNPVIDVEDVSMMLMHMESGVYASYEQCHYTPDYWRNYTVIGTEGRIENFGDGEGGLIRLWNRRTEYNGDGDEQFPIIGDANGHGDADVLTVSEFIRFVRTGAHTDTSPLGAWYAVAAGIQATDSLRNGSVPRRIPSLPDEIVTYFLNNQVK
ncbi:ROK family protein [Acidipropionibacterium jensenii]|uniref:ROK family protein n=1 Tax=Acidipropionibacterium jensenii TaxID=1749 RepID=UPI00214C6A95|nr:ROK family protein [Acidipropionibacterium jensenii]